MSGFLEVDHESWIPDLMEIISIIMVYQTDEEIDIMESWLIEDFKTYDAYQIYDSNKWKLIIKYAQNLLLKGSLKMGKV